ncbi:hypothetical protein N7471_013488 [Penicillium samsonianum]|uniref:uncharacterized protein n=1 Tax=Penicillium samsonianum TaxID=1882272 RepID=UPI002549A461|nr:uncharacterized protein N7471_013488 [Penicillium samsonianum]KAJ6118868.1 hypothetical protein N7471_013488 [Penicillium samsonianum]
MPLPDCFSTRPISVPSSGTSTVYWVQSPWSGTRKLSDKQITRLVRAYAAAYRERIHTLATTTNQDEVPRFTLDTAKDPLLNALRTACTQTLVDLLSSMTEMHDVSSRAVELLSWTLAHKRKPQDRATLYRLKDVVGRRDVGIGSAGLPSYSILLEDRSAAAAVSRHVTNSAARPYFYHEGHRTVISQRALQTYADA